MLPIVLLTIENEEEREFMSQLYLDFRQLMLAKIRALVSDPEAVEDIQHDAIVKLIGKVDLLRTLDRGRLISYIIETAQNTARDYLRKNTRVIVSEDALKNVVDPAVLPEAQILRGFSIVELRRIWPQMTESAQNLLKMKYFLRLSDEEIAAERGIKPRSVRMYLTRARREAYALLTADEKPRR